MASSSPSGWARRAAVGNKCRGGKRIPGLLRETFDMDMEAGRLTLKDQLAWLDFVDRAKGPVNTLCDLKKPFKK